MDEQLQPLPGDDLCAPIECTECAYAVDELVAIRDRWTFWSDGTDLRPFCPACVEREFAVARPIGLTDRLRGAIRTSASLVSQARP